jgi:hypothetical protein
MRKFDLISSTFWLIVATLICVESYRHNLGDFQNPGPGFLPFVSGLVMGGSGLLVMIPVLRKEVSEKKAFFEGGTGWHKVVLTLVPIFIYALLLQFMGFLLTTFLVMGSLFKFIEPQRWRTVFLWTIIATLGSYLIFRVWLEVDMPQGFLGI